MIEATAAIVAVTDIDIAAAGDICELPTPPAISTWLRLHSADAGADGGMEGESQSPPV